MAQRRKNLTAMSNTPKSALQSDPKAIVGYKTRKSIKAPIVKGQVLLRRAQGQPKSRIAKDLGMAHNTVTSILREADFDGQIARGQALCSTLVTKAVDVVDQRLTKGSENAAFKLLEGIGVLGRESKPTRPPDTGLTLAIQNLMGNVSVTTTNSALPAEQPKSTTLDVVPLPAKSE